jgi:hypothetical protein
MWTTVLEQSAGDQSISSSIYEPHSRTALTSADNLVAVSEQYVGLVVEGRSTRNSFSHCREVSLGLFYPGCGASIREKCPYDLAVHACPNFDLVCASLTTEVSTPFIGILNV